MDVLLGALTSCIVALLIAIQHHGAMVGSTLIPNLVDKVLITEHLEKMVLLARIHIVESLFQRVVPLVIRWQVFLGSQISSLLLELLKDGLICRIKGPVTR